MTLNAMQAFVYAIQSITKGERGWFCFVLFSFLLIPQSTLASFGDFAYALIIVS